MTVEVISTQVVTTGGGKLYRVQHDAESTKCRMTFAVFVPTAYDVVSGASGSRQPFPTMYWLSGLTCTDENFSQKAGPAAFPIADELGEQKLGD
jgi:S-formylglutathione hydrolase